MMIARLPLSAVRSCRFCCLLWVFFGSVDAEFSCSSTLFWQFWATFLVWSTLFSLFVLISRCIYRWWQETRAVLRSYRSWLIVWKLLIAKKSMLGYKMWFKIVDCRLLLDQCSRTFVQFSREVFWWKSNKPSLIGRSEINGLRISCAHHLALLNLNARSGGLHTREVVRGSG
jgi:hypothetical protein